MPIYDYMCPNKHVQEHRCHSSQRPETLTCPECDELAKQAILGAPSLFTLVVPDYPGSKKLKAGYQNSHGDFKGTYGKIQVGYGGKTVSADTPPLDPKAGIRHNPLG